MTYNNQEKIAFIKIISSLIKADGIININEIQFLKSAYDKLSINTSQIKQAEHISLEQAISIFAKTDSNIKKLALVRMLQQLAISDDDFDINEKMLTISIMMSIECKYRGLVIPKARLISTINNKIPTSFNHVIYLESQYDEYINNTIENDYDLIKSLLLKNGYAFEYIPSVISSIESQKELFLETLTYIEPTLSDKELSSIDHKLGLLKTELFANELFLTSLDQENTQHLTPSILFQLNLSNATNEYNYLLLELTSDETPLQTLNNMFSLLENITDIQPKLLNAKDKAFLLQFTIEKPRNIQNNNFISYTGFHKVIFDTILKYNSNKGLSRLYITCDGEILLMDKNETEVQMSAICKALYIFFILQQNAINLDELRNYRQEIFHIYKKISKSKDDSKLLDSIKTLTDYTASTLNSNITKIKKAFLNQLPDLEAKMYYISGSKGSKKQILINREYIIFEDDSIWRIQN